MNDYKLTEKQLLFVQAYVENFDERRAAEIAGYAPGAAAILLKHEKIQKVINWEAEKRYAPATPPTPATRGVTRVAEVDYMDDKDPLRLTKRYSKELTETVATEEQVLLELTRLATSDIRDYFDTDGSIKLMCELDDAAAASVAQLEYIHRRVIPQDGEPIVEEHGYKIKLWPKPSALDSLFKYYGLVDKGKNLSKGKQGELARRGLTKEGAEALRVHVLGLEPRKS